LSSWFPAVTTPPSLYALLPYCGQSSSGGSVTVGCLDSSYSPDSAIFTWRSNEQLITDQVKTYPPVFNKNGLYTLSSQLTIAEYQLDNIHCKVAHKSNTWPPVEIPIPVLYTKQPSVYLLLPSAEELSAQQSFTLSCLVKKFAPKEIFVEWTVNYQSIDANKYKNTEFMAESTDYSTYSMLSISAGDWDRGYSYSCVVGHETFPLKTLTRAVNKSSGKPSFVNISLVLMDTVNACQ
uniref:Ig-like domain-containing protein n=1 Tax=Callorhinchus milii TaxID=7868 RepID=A0A4W3GBZ3_CALMI